METTFVSPSATESAGLTASTSFGPPASLFAGGFKAASVAGVATGVGERAGHATCSRHRVARRKSATSKITRPKLMTDIAAD